MNPSRSLTSLISRTRRAAAGAARRAGELLSGRSDAESRGGQQCLTQHPGMPAGNGGVQATPGIDQNLLPESFIAHRFGLPTASVEQLKDRVFIVTGAGSGYGQAVAVALAQCGAHVLLMGRNEGKLTRTQEMARRLAPSGRTDIVPVDVTAIDALEKTAVDLLRHVPAPHGLVHCAALPSEPGNPFPLTMGAPGRLDKTLSVNGLAVLHLCDLFFPNPAKGLRAVLFSSTAGWASTPGFGAYNLSKTTLNALGHNLAAEYSTRFPEADIQINVLDPGEARSEMNQGSTISPFAAAPMTLALLAHPPGGPNGCFFHRDGRHLGFCFTAPYPRSLFQAG